MFFPISRWFAILTLCLLLPLAIDCRAQSTDTHLEISLSKKKLLLFDQGKKVKTYRIAVGRDTHETPTGDMKLSTIVWNPWWYPPKDSQWADANTDMPPGPNNPMGAVKMGIGGRIFIHGTNTRTGAKLLPTHGCIRLSNTGVKQLAGWLQGRFGKNLDAQAFKKSLAEKTQNLTVSLERPIPVFVHE